MGHTRVVFEANATFYRMKLKMPDGSLKVIKFEGGMDKGKDPNINGVFATSDPDLIEALKENPNYNVRYAVKKERELSAKEAEDKGLAPAPQSPKPQTDVDYDISAGNADSPVANAGEAQKEPLKDEGQPDQSNTESAPTAENEAGDEDNTPQGEIVNDTITSIQEAGAFIAENFGTSKASVSTGAKITAWLSENPGKVVFTKIPMLHGG